MMIAHQEEMMTDQGLMIVMTGVVAVLLGMKRGVIGGETVLGMIVLPEMTGHPGKMIVSPRPDVKAVEDGGIVVTEAHPVMHPEKEAAGETVHREMILPGNAWTALPERTVEVHHVRSGDPAVMSTRRLGGEVGHQEFIHCHVC
jgi:hypothetical protein